MTQNGPNSDPQRWPNSSLGTPEMAPKPPKKAQKWSKIRPCSQKWLQEMAQKPGQDLKKMPPKTGGGTPIEKVCGYALPDRPPFLKPKDIG